MTPLPHIVLDFLNRHFSAGGRLGLIGVGRLGTAIREEAIRRDIAVMLCDPPRNLDEATELSESFFDLWGNGMGGCNLTNTGMEVFLPLDSMTSAAAISIQVPLTDDGPFPTRGLITRDFLDRCSPSAAILCLSAPAVIADGARNDPRIIYGR